MLTDRQVVERVARGDFTVTAHAVESFRVRLANLNKGRAVMTIRRQLIEVVKENGLASLDFQTVPGQSRVFKVTHPRYKYKFWAVVAEDRIEEGELVVITVYRPGRAVGAISVKDHYTALDELHRKLLRAEDKYYELFERIFKREKSDGSNQAVSGGVHCECCIHNLLSDDEAAGDTGSQTAPGPGGVQERGMVSQ